MEKAVASSTSSSRVSPQPWHRTVGWALLCVFIALAGWELTWRLQGYRPSVKDDFDRWSRATKEAVWAGEDAVALLGSSRIMQALDLPTLRQQLPAAVPVQLGMSGASPLPVLEFLAEHTTFNGTAVVEITPTLLLRPQSVSKQWVQRRLGQIQAERLLSEPSFFDFERKIATWLQEHLLVASWVITPTGLLKSLAKGEWPTRPFWWISHERQQFMDYTGVDTEAFKQSRIAAVAGAGAFQPQALQQVMPRIKSWATKIEERGGKVLFLRTPTQGELLAIEVERYPRSEFWDVLLHRTDIPGLHFSEVPGMQSFTCTDLEHIDSESSPLFTQLFVEHIVGSGLLVRR